MEPGVPRFHKAVQRRGSSLTVAPSNRRQLAQPDDEGAVGIASRRKAKPGAPRAGDTPTDFRDVALGLAPGVLLLTGLLDS